MAKKNQNLFHRRRHRRKSLEQENVTELRSKDLLDFIWKRQSRHVYSSWTIFPTTDLLQIGISLIDHDQ